MPGICVRPWCLQPDAQRIRAGWASRKREGSLKLKECLDGAVSKHLNLMVAACHILRKNCFESDSSGSGVIPKLPDNNQGLWDLYEPMCSWTGAWRLLEVQEARIILVLIKAPTYMGVCHEGTRVVI